MYFNLSNEYKALANYDYCAIQPYLSGNPQVDLLIRNHNWASGVKTPVEIKYKVILNPDNQQKYSTGYGFWENEGKAIKSTIEYISTAISHITGAFPYYFDPRYIPEYMVAMDGRDEYKLYECNYPSSDTKTTYAMEVKLENIKRKLDDYSNNDNIVSAYSHDSVYCGKKINESLAEFKWMESIDSVFDLIKNPHMQYTTEDMLKLAASFGTTPTDVIPANELTDQELNKLDMIIGNIFNSAASVANIKFIPTLEEANLELKLDIVKENDKPGIPEGGAEDFYYDQGKTIYAEYKGKYSSSNGPLSATNWKDAFHELSHVSIDHPQDSVFAPDFNLHDEDTYTKIIDQEYKAYSGCMSVMNTIYNDGCSFEEKALYPISYLPIDIQALQHMYGKNEDTRSGDTKYILTEKQTFIDDLNHQLFPMDIPENSIYSLYDAGGINTLDLTLIKQAKIDLNEGAGHFNVIENDNIFLIAYGTHIHNVIIDSGNIEIKLNNNISNAIKIPSNGAHVTIEDFNVGYDAIVLDDNANQEIDFTGCIKPYSNSGDDVTEICFL